jgi:dihydrofolate reductase
MRAEPGKDIWLFGGGLLFRSLLEARLVDTVEVGVMPVLLGGGVPPM